MDGPHVFRAEYVRQIGRHGGEAAAVHRQDHAERGDEQPLLTRMSERGRQRVKHDPQREEHEIGVLAAELVGRRGPEETARDIEQRQQADEARRDLGHLSQLLRAQRLEPGLGLADQAAGEDFLQHRRGHRQHADARRNVKSQHAPDHPELRGLVRVRQRDRLARDHRVGGRGGRRPACGAPTFGRHAIA